MQANPVSPFRRRTALASLVVAGALALAGCAALQPKTPEEIVTQRVEARWDALIKGDFPAAWAYTQPAYRAIVKQADYAKTFGAGGQWRGVQVHQVSCEAERCTVRIRLTTRVTLPPFRGQELTGALDETWVREDGNWWYYQNF
ncbi:MAG TPA: hypothetical protein PKA18_00580 [Ottowia sp.]|mgnify:FL=1|jgi:hypothetical protein|nr:MAG: hypothetical protein BGO36_13875 [Burkholderiales bacterium 68-10]HMT81937.1 hypothetical protein [Ottowia sp.]HQX66622.1 hypothetical protein [Ottowia sp.]HQZ56840.1 hypothetical protein [Ottowia sp.]HRB09484.1 hypothetical protein [Ottowia sp.]